MISFLFFYWCQGEKTRGHYRYTEKSGKITEDTVNSLPLGNGNKGLRGRKIFFSTLLSSEEFEFFIMTMCYLIFKEQKREYDLFINNTYPGSAK